MEIALGVEQLRRPKPDGRQIAHYYHAIGQIYRQLGNHNEALTYYQRAIEIGTQHFSRNHPFIANCMMNRSLVLYRENRLEEVSTNIKESGKILASSLSTNHGMQIFVHLTTAKDLFEKNDWSGALASYQAALKCSHQHVPSNHSSNVPILWGIASAHIQQGQLDEAQSILQQALNILTAAHSPKHSDLAMTYMLIGEVLERQRNLSALSYYQRALDLGLKSLPPTNPIIVQIQQAISRLQH
jgi:tetratricopeptide (TPR) repeat protein